ncbi:hypothetical protein DYBT9275_04510 [Dyadobacter sp. CECT 9275]|uniref:SPOR domain-containing protein n=1 Tax=Dyadobacter helix TaxID=2822344 RepID=A0A916JGU2_9BACT|nr:SPOR domain-containing protein [Dyadobacter sp. CECT 9275]CAG5009487.1 hypothetical protein DYBT9275_04510 [Dyadobacter sp. CECT 9275]
MSERRNRWAIVLLAAGIILSGCSRKPAASSSASTYNEDLSRVRPKYEYKEPPVKKKSEEIQQEGKPKADTNPGKSLSVNKKLEAVLDTMVSQNKSIKYINGFRIQIYVGNVRQEADAAKSYVYQVFPDLNPYMSYTQPTYRVKVGDFMYRSDAEQYLEQIREQYSSATILADRVEIKKSLMLNSSYEN